MEKEVFKKNEWKFYKLFLYPKKNSRIGVYWIPDSSSEKYLIPVLTLENRDTVKNIRIRFLHTELKIAYYLTP